MILIYIFYVHKNMVKNLSVRKCLQDIERCSLCGNLDSVFFFDMDHKIPTFLGGPNSRWNIWPVCLRCHRLKCHYESFALHSPQMCFSCQKTMSQNEKINIENTQQKTQLWCLECMSLPFHIRVLNLECNIKNNIVHFFKKNL